MIKKIGTIFLLALALSAPVVAECTRVIGFSVTAQWFSGGFQFSPELDMDAWELMHTSGAGVTQYSDPDYYGWDDTVSLEQGMTPCTGPITRIIYNVAATQCETDWTYFVPYIEQVLDNIRMYYPGIPIFLQATVGGPNGQQCPWAGSSCYNAVKESVIAPPISTAIQHVAALHNDVGVGPSPHVDSCADFGDSVGHLVRPRFGDARWRVGQWIAAWWADYDGGGPPPPPVSNCENQIPDGNCNWLGAGETYATCPEDCPPCP